MTYMILAMILLFCIHSCSAPVFSFQTPKFLLKLRRFIKSTFKADFYNETKNIKTKANILGILDSSSLLW